jgi:hypothetical protein
MISDGWRNLYKGNLGLALIQVGAEPIRTGTGPRLGL